MIYTIGMRILLTEGSGLTARQVSKQLQHLGHDVGVVSSDPLGIARFSNSVRWWHRVPAFGPDPLGWLDQCLDCYDKGSYDLLFPTQEQVTVLAASQARLTQLGVVTAVPDLGALAQVQDKVSAHATLARLGIAQPSTTIARTREEFLGWSRYPGFAKVPIGTASGGVWPVHNKHDLRIVAGNEAIAEALDDEGVILQEKADGPLAMVQSVWDHGRLVAFHANERVREGARGGASHKRSVDIPQARHYIEVLGEDLCWHGALSVDIICSPTGPLVIDVNPRLVEPANAIRSGTDLVAAMVAVAQARAAMMQPVLGQVGVRTHQLLLAVLGDASDAHPRRAVAAELVSALLHRRDYADSAEECTPLEGDLRAGLPLAVIATAAMAHPPTWRWFAGSSVASYALTPTSWKIIKDTSK